MFPFLSIYIYCRNLPLLVSFILFHSTARRIRTDSDRQAASVTQGVERLYPGYYKTLVVAKQERVAAREATSAASLYDNMLRENIQGTTKPAIRRFSCHCGVLHILRVLKLFLENVIHTLLRAKKFIFKENCSCYEVKILFSAIITSFMPSKLSYFTSMKLLLNIKLCCIRVKHIIINRINHPYVHPSIFCWTRINLIFCFCKVIM